MVSALAYSFILPLTLPAGVVLVGLLEFLCNWAFCTDSSVMVECVEGLQLAVGVLVLRFLLQDWYGCNIVDLGTDVSVIRFSPVCVVRTYQEYPGSD